MRIADGFSSIYCIFYELILETMSNLCEILLLDLRYVEVAHLLFVVRHSRALTFTSGSEWEREMTPLGVHRLKLALLNECVQVTNEDFQDQPGFVGCQWL